MLAAYYGHAGVVKLLIEHGADPNRLNDKGQSPIAGAVFKKEDEVIEVCTAPPLFTFNLFPALHSLVPGVAPFRSLTVLPLSQGSAGGRRRPGLWEPERHAVRCHVPAGGEVEGQV